MAYEVIRNKTLFTTNGLMPIVGAELEVELDWLTAERIGEKSVWCRKVKCFTLFSLM